MIKKFCTPLIWALLFVTFSSLLSMASLASKHESFAEDLQFYLQELRRLETTRPTDPMQDLQLTKAQEQGIYPSETGHIPGAKKVFWIESGTSNLDKIMSSSSLTPNQKDLLESALQTKFKEKTIKPHSSDNENHLWQYYFYFNELFNLLKTHKHIDEGHGRSYDSSIGERAKLMFYNQKLNDLINPIMQGLSNTLEKQGYKFNTLLEELEYYIVQSLFQRTEGLECTEVPLTSSMRLKNIQDDLKNFMKAISENKMPITEKLNILKTPFKDQQLKNYQEFLKRNIPNKPINQAHALVTLQGVGGQFKKAIGKILSSIERILSCPPVIEGGYTFSEIGRIAYNVLYQEELKAIKCNLRDAIKKITLNQGKNTKVTAERAQVKPLPPTNVSELFSEENEKLTKQIKEANQAVSERRKKERLKKQKEYVKRLEEAASCWKATIPTPEVPTELKDFHTKWEAEINKNIILKGPKQMNWKQIKNAFTSCSNFGVEITIESPKTGSHHNAILKKKDVSVSIILPKPHGKSSKVQKTHVQTRLKRLFLIAAYYELLENTDRPGPMGGGGGGGSGAS